MSRLLGTGRQHIIAQLRGISDESLCLNQATGCCALICHPSRNFQAVGTGGSEGGRAFAGGCIDNLARRKSNNSFFPGCQRFSSKFFSRFTSYLHFVFFSFLLFTVAHVGQGILAPWQRKGEKENTKAGLSIEFLHRNELFPLRKEGLMTVSRITSPAHCPRRPIHDVPDVLLSVCQRECTLTFSAPPGFANGQRVEKPTGSREVLPILAIVYSIFAFFPFTFP